MGVAQLVEHWSPKPGVASSNLAAHAIFVSVCNFIFHKKTPQKTEEDGAR